MQYNLRSIYTMRLQSTHYDIYTLTDSWDWRDKLHGRKSKKKQPKTLGHIKVKGEQVLEQLSL